MDINMVGICRSFGTNKVLGGVNLHIRPGEVHALMGENGAGKSTLMNILTGIHKADAGTILVDGKEVTFQNNKDAEEHGIAFIHQELNIWPNLSVLENLFPTNQPRTRLGLIDFKEMRRRAEAKCKEIGIELPLDAIAGECSVGQQQMTEITRNLMLDAKTVIMDEPTAALTERETDSLFAVMIFPTAWKKYSITVIQSPSCVTDRQSVRVLLKKQEWTRLSMIWLAVS